MAATTTSSLLLRFSHPATRLLRQLVLRLLDPLEHISRSFLGQSQLPPLSLRHFVGSEASTREFLAYLQLLCGLRPSDHVLDIGCGCGMMALQLTKCLDVKGRYVGADPVLKYILWCQRHITSQFPNFTFFHADVRNGAYNPKGHIKAEDYRFPLEDHSFDLIFLKSVFTHMLPAEVENYLSEVSRLLKSDGKCLGTFFLLNPRQKHLAELGLNRIDFVVDHGAWYCKDETVPESAVAYREDFVLELLGRYGLALVEPPRHGTWSGGKDGLAFFQDVILMSRATMATR